MQVLSSLAIEELASFAFFTEKIYDEQKIVKERREKNVEREGLLRSLINISIDYRIV